jgi:hypothetical protein
MKSKNKVFSTLRGSNSGDVDHRLLFNSLLAKAEERGIYPGSDISTDSFLENRPAWDFEHRRTGDEPSLFFLVVLASSNGPGVSPIFPFNKPDNGPMFAVHFWGSNCIVWQEMIFRSQFVECNNSEEIAGAFMRFLDEWNFTPFDSSM